MTHESDLQRWTVSALRRRCEQETRLFFQRQQHDSQYCFELFRRAILAGDDEAWEAVYAQYYPMVVGWVRRHSSFASVREEAQYFANSAFGKMWVSLTSTPERFTHFPNLAALLRFLQMCSHSVIIDHLRAEKRSQLGELNKQKSGETDEPDIPAPDFAPDYTEHREIWGQIIAGLHDEKERLVVTGTFIYDLRPGDIYEIRPKIFTDVREVYRIKQNVLARFRRDEAFKRLFDVDD